MSDVNLPLCYHPTRCLFINDDQHFLQTFSNRSAPQLDLIMFAQPKKALDFLNNDYGLEPFNKRILFQEKNENSEEQVATHINLRRIYEEIYSPNRFAEISIVIVDCTLSSMNGLDVCQAIKNPHIKKLMLIEETDLSIAVTAFNQGLIDKFILKNQQNLDQNIVQAITQLQLKYFADLSEKIVNKTTLMQTPTLACLFDAAFCNYFQQLCSKYEIIEYYLTDLHGSYLLLDKDSIPRWLATLSEEGLTSFYDFANYAGDASTQLLSDLHSGKKVPYFFNSDDFSVPTTDWQSYMHSAEKIIGKNAYFTAVIDNHHLYRLNNQAILSYQGYLANLGRLPGFRFAPPRPRLNFKIEG